MTTELKQIVEYLKDYSYKVSNTASTGTYVNSGELNKKEDSIILTYNTSNL